ncbi:MAG: tetratricopeptide repeat protein, partial [bacterium]
MCAGNRFTFIMIPCILLIVAQAVTPQVQSGKLTKQEFKDHLLQAIESRSQGTAAKLIRQNRYKTGFVVDGLLQSYLKPDAEGDSLTAEHKIEMAREIAEIYRDQFENDFFINRIDLYRKWTGEQKKEKLYADSLRNASADEFNNHQFESALKMVQEALRIYERLDDIEAQGKCSNSIGLLYFRLTDFPEAERHLKRSLQINRQIENPHGVIANLDNLAALYKAQYKYQPALEAFDEAIALSDAIADEESRANQWMSIGSIYQAMKKYDEALKNYNLALEYADKSHNDKLKASALLNRGSLSSDQSRFKDAIRDWQGGVALARKMRNHDLEGSFLANLSIAYRNISKFDSSLTMLNQALGLTRKTANRWTEGNILREIGVVMYFKGLPDSSLVYWNKAIEVFKDIPDMAMVGMVTGHIGVVFKNSGQPFKALEAYQNALSL